MEEDFEALGEIFLDPLLATRPLFWAGIYERVGSEAVRRVFRGPVPPCHSFQFDKGNVGYVAKHGVRRIIPDVTKDAQYSECFVATKSEWVEPIVFDGRVFGVIDLEDDKTDSFSSKEEPLFERLASEVAALMAWQSAPWASRLKALRLLANLKKKYDVYDWVGIYRLTESQQELTLSAFLGSPTPHLHIPVSEGICGAAVREDRTINVPNVMADPRFIACSLTTQSELVVPIRNAEGRVVAELDIDSDAPDAFTPERIAQAEATADMLSKIPELFR